ncbi:MAG TPA: prepilin-type N-terminal cleavage/methylation domain-containing protein, partial [bacterium]|nr:prepilin-type N-terminal cleavage/methylation domain-containing protein [bacterium]
MRHPLRSMASRGFTLLEVMIGITLLVIIVLPLASLYAVSLTTIQQSALYSQALGLARDRMEMVQAMDYGVLGWELESLVPGFEWHNRPGYIIAYQQRDVPSTPELEEVYDPTRNNGSVDYEIPIYRDYYSNFTGQLLDPNFNGLCDDDLNGDGVVDILDQNICNPNGDVWNTTNPDLAFLNGQQQAGDGIYDTVVEGLYA